MLIRSYRLERKHLRLDVLLELDHKPRHLWPVLSDAYQGDIGVVRLNLANQLLQSRGQIESVDVDDQP